MTFVLLKLDNTACLCPVLKILPLHQSVLAVLATKLIFSIMAHSHVQLSGFWKSMQGPGFAALLLKYLLFEC